MADSYTRSRSGGGGEPVHLETFPPPPKPRINLSTPVRVTQFELKSHDSPDEFRNPDKTRIEVVRLEGFTMGRLVFEPGWRWSECIKPVVNTDSCQVSHVGYAVSGRLTVRLTDGTERVIGAGDSYTIPPGHDAWVEGTEPFVGIEVMSADVFGKPQ